jgi:hypothetical protein
LRRAPDPSPTRWGTQHLQRACRGHVGYSKQALHHLGLFIKKKQKMKYRNKISGKEYVLFKI